MEQSPCLLHKPSTGALHDGRDNIGREVGYALQVYQAAPHILLPVTPDDLDALRYKEDAKVSIGALHSSKEITQSSSLSLWGAV